MMRDGDFLSPPLFLIIVKNIKSFFYYWYLKFFTSLCLCKRRYDQEIPIVLLEISTILSLPRNSGVYFALILVFLFLIFFKEDLFNCWCYLILNKIIKEIILVWENVPSCEHSLGFNCFTQNREASKLLYPWTGPTVK